MLLKNYRQEIFRPECNPGFQSLHCIAHLDEDISAVLPYLNTVLGGFEYLRNPPSLTLRLQGKLITLHAHRIAINALKDEEEATKILAWLQREINSTWEQRAEIEPSDMSAPRPKVLEVLKRLPGTNCRQCNQPTCMVFATLAVDGVKGAEDCLPLDEPGRTALNAYLSPFRLDP
ncbi:(Fe-S)-binding protein [Thermodesulfobacteriota bacterium]